jgi:hypothetical protein
MNWLQKLLGEPNMGAIAEAQRDIALIRYHSEMVDSTRVGRGVDYALIKLKGHSAPWD